MANATDHLTSNYLKAIDLEDGVIVRAVILAARPNDFEDGTTKLVIYTDHKAKGVVLNQTRLKTMIEAFGPNTDNWVGKTINLRRGPTMFKGEATWAIYIDVDLSERIAVRDLNVTAIGDHRRQSGPPVPPAHNTYYGPTDGGGDTTEDVPF
jgi:hypothetical protein